MFGDIQKLQKNRQRQGKWIRMAVAVALVLTVVLILATGKEEPPVAVAPTATPIKASEPTSSSPAPEHSPTAAKPGNGKKAK